ncbi:serine/threonine-protein kinase [Candidatus Uabimicrobium sp. HlEnr_7]|uniref:serine/threonine-protein kinase n=1 Tax=Candidatus Uabimicrobium helgolandensis TaxID=3095367 RepID=UPI0035576064
MVKPERLLKNRYKLDKVLGQGGMGCVYLATDTKNRCKVAIKQILVPSNSRSTKDLITRFRREYLFLSEINHPNIVKAYDFFSEELEQVTLSQNVRVEKQYFIVLEWVRGLSLKEFLEKKPGSLNLLEQLAIAIQLGRAIEIINNAGIIHRDIKPMNIIIDERQKCVKVLDLGIAKSVKNDMDSLTNTGSAVGTPEYMSPEQIDGEIANNSDIFSLGLVLYQFFLWRKQSPFKSETLVATMMAIATKDLPPLSEQLHLNVNNREPYSQISTLLSQAMIKDPQQRIANITDLVDTLEKIHEQHSQNKKKNKQQAWLPTVRPNTQQLEHIRSLRKKYERESTGSPKVRRKKKRKSRRSTTSNARIYQLITLLLLSIVGVSFLFSFQEDNFLQRARNQFEQQNFSAAFHFYIKWIDETGDTGNTQLWLEIQKVVEQWKQQSSEHEKKQIIVFLQNVKQKFTLTPQWLSHEINSQIKNSTPTQKVINEKNLQKEMLEANRQKFQDFLAVNSKLSYAIQWQNCNDFLQKNAQFKIEIQKQLQSSEAMIEQQLQSNIKQIKLAIKTDNTYKKQIYNNQEFQIISKISQKNVSIASLLKQIENLSKVKKVPEIKHFPKKQPKKITEKEWQEFYENDFKQKIAKHKFDTLLSTVKKMHKQGEPNVSKQIKYYLYHLNNINRAFKKFSNILYKKQKQIITVSDLNGQVIRGTLQKIRKGELFVKNYKNEILQVRILNLNVRSLEKYLSQKEKEKKSTIFALAWLFLYENKLLWGKKYLEEAIRKAPENAKVLKDEWEIALKKDQIIQRVIITSPKGLTPQKPVSVPPDLQKIIISGTIENKFLISFVKLNSRNVSWDSKTKTFSHSVKLKYGKNDFKLAIVDIKKNKRTYKYQIIRSKIEKQFVEPVFRGSMYNTGHYMTRGVHLLPKIKWKQRFRQEVRCTPTIYKGNLYFGGGDDNIYSFNLQSGRKNWQYSTNQDIHSAPAIYKGVVYCGSTDKNIYALNIETGKKIWSYKTHDEVHASPKIVNDILYVGDFSGYFYALDCKSRELKWTFKSAEKIFSSAAIHDNIVYFGGRDDNMYAFNATTGKQIWKFPSKDSIQASPILNKGVLYFNDFSHKIYALDAKNGKKKWVEQYKGKSETYSSLALARGILYYGSSDGNLYALREDNGKEIWQFQVGGPIYTSPSVADGTVYVTCLDHYIYAIDAQTGKEKWRFKVKAAIQRYSSPAIYNGIVYFGADDNHIYALSN